MDDSPAQSFTDESLEWLDGVVDGFRISVRGAVKQLFPHETVIDQRMVREAAIVVIESRPDYLDECTRHKT